MDLRRRVIDEHCSASYRTTHPSLNYYFWEVSEDGFFLAPVYNQDLCTGPLLNLLEQWLAVIFRGLQPHELEKNLPEGGYEMLSVEERETGAGLAEPFMQGISFRAWPGRKNFALSSSSDPVKRDYAVVQRNQSRTSQEKRNSFKNGRPYLPVPWIPKRSGWEDGLYVRRPEFPESAYKYGFYTEAVVDRIISPHGPVQQIAPWIGERTESGVYPLLGRNVRRKEWGVFSRASRIRFHKEDYYQCVIEHVDVFVLKNTVLRFKPDSLKLKVDVLPPGQLHPFCAVPDFLDMWKHKDQALRLGFA